MEGKNIFLLFLRRCALEAADDDHYACSFPFIRGERSLPLCALSRRVPVAEWADLADGYTAQYAGNYSNSGTLNATSLRIDHFFSSHFSIFGRYNYAPSQTVSLSSPSELDTIPVNTQTFTVGVNSQWRNSLANSLRGNYSMQTSNMQAALHAMGGATLPAPSLYLGDLPFPANELNFQTFDTYYFAAGRSVITNRSK